MSNTKLLVDNKSVFVSVLVKPKDKIYIPSFKRNHEEKAYVVRLDKSKSSDVGAEVSKPTITIQKKSIFMPTCHLCGVVCHISPNCSLLRQKLKSKFRSVVRNTYAPKFIHVCHFCAVSGHIPLNCHKLKFKHFVFQSRICDDISPATSFDKLFHMILKNLSLLACESKL